MAIIGNKPESKGIVSVTRSDGNGAAGTTDTYTILFSNSTTSTFQINNGASLDTVNSQIAVLTNDLLNIDMTEVAETANFKRLTTTLKLQIEDLIAKLIIGIPVIDGKIFNNPPSSGVFVQLVSSPSIGEGSPLIFNVTLSATTTASKIFSYAVSGSATGAVDYSVAPIFNNGVTLTGSQLTVPSGVSEFTITFNTIPDTLVEANETVILVIDGAAGIGTIVNDDVLTIASVSSPTSLENDPLIFEVRITGNSTVPFNFSYSASGSAILGTNYSSAPPILSDGASLSGSTITVPAGVTYFTITYATIRDNVFTGNLTLNTNVGGITGTGTIVNVDSGFSGSIIPNGTTFSVPNGAIYALKYPILIEPSGKIVFGVGSALTNASRITIPTSIAAGTQQNLTSPLIIAAGANLLIQSTASVVLK